VDGADNQHIEAAERIARARHGLHGRRFVTRVGGERRYVAAAGAHGLGHGIERVGIDVDTGHRRALGGEVSADRGADPAARSGHDGHFAVQPPHARFPFPNEARAIIGPPVTAANAA
jgi:hypothetical protein